MMIMEKKPRKTSQTTVLIEYFKNHPNKDIPHAEIVRWALNEFNNRTGRVYADPDRGIRKLHQGGFLVKVKKGVYRYDPSMVQRRELEDFTPAIKQAIFKRDGFKCVICGRGPKDGVEIQADHIKPKDLGGKATLENGQTLCAQHNFLKKNFKQTETGKKMFIRLYDLAKSTGDQGLVKFCTEILDTFERNGINGHIEWKR